ncbi:2-succinyl-6-hydroxy-2,4-cyclohexadiene-1-carboxylate synthase [Echinimonas agarilytica]|uniref:2-succinyl-6-hydroxy-2,4-cyclohexadiene-1-carboxylate synthase n=1 Tax=Echinimonas agarilytica TaxID=1215918 RepID=A0AA42B907_9GAMM|nr:2-succinyl-6-hydroxy-2,4-cyclohexadiene-1-carboxylate synthase [Echinimonas agarilytica]MCM2681098.1 2-succinyl-6-hydroxy-2,4-cyclohexadiene-1-carboxylate synthase [Echinimonas agarilytica]
MPNTLHCKVVGQYQPHRPDIVMLHGFLGQHRDWLQVIQPWQHQYRFILVDLPGHGLSRVEYNTDNGFEHAHQSLVNTLQQLNVGRYQLLGYSLGGRLAMYHALQQPCGLESLLLESCHPGVASVRIKLKRDAWEKQWQQRLLQQSTEVTLNKWYQQAVFASLTRVQRQQQIQRKLLNPNKTQWARALGSLSLRKQPNLWQIGQQTDLRVHYIVGANDPRYATLARKMLRSSPTAKITIVRNAGHNIHFTAPHAWQHHFEQWLKLGFTHA